MAQEGVTAVAWCEIERGRDFFAHTDRHDWIVTNPPWSKMRPFIQHCMAVADNIVLLAPLNAFLTRARRKDTMDAGYGLREALLLDNPPKPWPRGGFQLAAVWISKGWTGPLAFSELAEPVEYA
jgi:hypothetical protein